MKITEYDNAKMKEMNDKDKRMLESALWHISNSVTNGKSQTAECEITQWLKEKFNVSLDEQPSEDLKKAANIYANKQGLELKPFARRFFIAGAQWQKEQMMKSAVNGIMDCDDSNEWVEIMDRFIVTPATAGKKVKIYIIEEDKQ